MRHETRWNYMKGEIFHFLQVHRFARYIYYSSTSRSESRYRQISNQSPLPKVQFIQIFPQWVIWNFVVQSNKNHFLLSFQVPEKIEGHICPRARVQIWKRSCNQIENNCQRWKRAKNITTELEFSYYSNRIIFTVIRKFKNQFSLIIF